MSAMTHMSILKDVVLGMESNGFSEHEDLHLVMLDLDRDCSPGLIHDAMFFFEIAHGEIFESTPGKYWFFGYALLPLNEYLAFGQMIYSDQRHLACIRYNNAGTIRLTPKLHGFPRSIMEMGTSSQRSRGLQRAVHSLLNKERIWWEDHYGKEN